MREKFCVPILNLNNKSRIEKFTNDKNLEDTKEKII